MKVALYARVSLEERDKDDRRYQEPENQLEPLRSWAKSQGWELYREYVDRGSGADPNRKEFRAMLADAMMLRVQAIIVWKLDRFSRETMSQCVGRIQKLRERGVAIHSLTESWLNTDPSNPMGELVIAVMAWAAAEERRKISERTKAGIAQRRGINQWKGGRPRSCACGHARKSHGRLGRSACSACACASYAPAIKGLPATVPRFDPPATKRDV